MPLDAYTQNVLDRRRVAEDFEALVQRASLAGMTHRQIASMLDTSQSKVHRTLRKLRES